MFGFRGDSRIAEERDRRFKEKETRNYEALYTKYRILEGKHMRQMMTINQLRSDNQTLTEQRNQALLENEEQNKLLTKLVSSLVAVEMARERMRDPEAVDSWSIETLVNYAIDTVRARERGLRRQLAEATEELKLLQEAYEELKEQVHNLQKARLRMGSMLQADESPNDAESEPQVDASSRSEKVHQNEPTTPPVRPSRPTAAVDYEQVEPFDDPAYADWENEPVPAKHTDSRTKPTPRRPTEDRRESKPPSSPLYVENLADIAENLTNEHHVLLEIIGKTGIFRTPELKEHPRFLETFSPTSNYFTQQIQDLATLGLVEQRQVRVGARGHNYDTFRLTEKGVQLFEALQGQQPVRSQLDVLTDRHGSEEHSLLILDTMIVLQKAGYEVDDTADGNTVKVGDGSTAIFDLTVKKGGDVRRIECERGKQSEADIHNKLNKWIQITPRFYYVSPNKSAKETVKEKFFKWASRIGRAQLAEKGVIAHFTTLEDLKKRGDSAWEEVKFSS